MAADGDIVFVSPQDDGRFLLMRYDQDSRSTTPLFELASPSDDREFQSLGPPVVGPDGQVAFDRRAARSKRYQLLIRNVRGDVVGEVSTEFGGEKSWQQGPLIAVSPGSDSWRTALVDPDSGEVQVVEGWRSLDWSPDGELLLYQREDSVLGVAKAATPTDIEPIGKLKDGTVYDAAWIE